MTDKPGNRGAGPDPSFPPPPPPGYGPPEHRVQDTPRAAGHPAYGTPPPPASAQGYRAALGPGSLPGGAEYASWASRAGAALLDLVFVGVLPLFPLIAVFGVVDAVSPQPPPEPDGTQNASTAATVVLMVGLLGQVCFWVWNAWRSGSRGQSLGKLVVGIHLVGDRSRRPPGGGAGLGRALLRSVIGSVTFGVYGLLTALWPLWDDRRQTLDDKLVNTLVLRFPGNRLPDLG